MDEERELNALTKVNKLPKVNKELATKLQTDLNLDNKGRNSKKKKMANELLNDDRFKSLFNNPDFEVDKDSEQFQQIVGKIKKEKEKNIGRVADDSDEEEVDDDDNADSDGDEDELQEDGPVRNSRSYDNAEVSSEESDDADETDESDNDEEEMEQEPAPKKSFVKNSAKKPSNFKFVGLDSSREFKAFVPNQDEDDFVQRTHGTMKQRRKQLGEMKSDETVESTPFGGKSMTFTMQRK